MESTLTIPGFSARTVEQTVPISVSESMESLSVVTPRRLARSFICPGDSSPATYKISMSRFAHICKSIVDFPMPGSPLTRTTEPLTMAPPRTLFNSEIPVSVLCSLSFPICDNFRLFAGAFAFCSIFFDTSTGADISSVKVFHAPQF